MRQRRCSSISRKHFPVLLFPFLLLGNPYQCLEGVHGFVAAPMVFSFPKQQQQRRQRLELLTKASSVVERLELTDYFNRWKFVQKLLDYELEAQHVNEVLYVLLHNYYQKATSTSNMVTEQTEDIYGEESSAPEQTSELLECVSRVLALSEGSSCSIPVVVDPDCAPGEQYVLNLVQQLLPNPIEKEDAFKGAWDTVLELHGKAAVTWNEKEGRSAWKAVFMIARVMIYFDFLSGEGVALEPSS